VTVSGRVSQIKRAAARKTTVSHKAGISVGFFVFLFSISTDYSTMEFISRQ